MTSAKKKKYGQPPKPGAALTPVELKVLRCCANGFSRVESGEKLDMSAHTVDWHIRQILPKLRANNMTNAVYKGFKQGLVK